MDDSSTLIQSRPYGGVGIIIRKVLRKYVNFVFRDNCRVIGAEVSRNDDKYLFINAYMPFQCVDN